MAYISQAAGNSRGRPCKQTMAGRLAPRIQEQSNTGLHEEAAHFVAGVHSAMSTARTWTVKFEGVAQPETFRQRLLKSPFYGRVESPSASVEGTALQGGDIDVSVEINVEELHYCIKKSIITIQCFLYFYKFQIK